VIVGVLPAVHRPKAPPLAERIDAHALFRRPLSIRAPPRHSNPREWNPGFP
jgi:hypothetical protein